MTRVLIANRGEIAMRIIRACRELGWSPVVVYSTADADSSVVAAADDAFCVGPGPAVSSYLNQGAVLTAAQAMGAELIHPGYGFLAENAGFAEACRAAGRIFVGPAPEVISLMGDKIRARAFAIEAGVPVLPGAVIDDPDQLDIAMISEKLGSPLLVKAAAGGGGRGMRIVPNLQDLSSVVREASQEAAAAFGDGTVYLERLVTHARHIEVQIFGQGPGDVVNLGERECSVQRRHQKVIEEAGSIPVSAAMQHQMRSAAVELANRAGYLSAGTVEFLVDPTSEQFYFLEMNTRLQVEHPVTEYVTGVDIVRHQLLLAAGTPEHLKQEDISVRGHAIECRVTAEDPARDFRPSPGVLTDIRWPAGPGIRVDTYLAAGSVVSPFYDSMIAKIIAHDVDRPRALLRMGRALAECRIDGVTTNIDLLRRIVCDPTFITNTHSTAWLENSTLLNFSAPSKTQ